MGPAFAGTTEESVLVRALPERGLLLFRRVLLVFRLPFVVRHAVHRFAACVLAERDAARVGRLLHPVGQAIAAEAGEVHQVDVLDLGMGAQMLHQAPEYRRLELGAGLVVHGHVTPLLRRPQTYERRSRLAIAAPDSR